MNRLWKGALVVLAMLWLWPYGVAATELRLPKVADKFYPGEPSELRDLIVELLQRQPEPVITKKPRVLISPHAGYQYSGLVAASGYRHLQGHVYDGVVVVGFTHRMQFPGSSVDTREAYETPLGDIPVDQEAVAVLQTYPGISHVEAAHDSGEHSLEVQLPFLQVALKRFRLVPVLMGNRDYEAAGQLATGLAALTKIGDYLFVFSTDLSHYHPYDEAEALDNETINAILLETPEAVHRLFRQGKLEACGWGPIVTSLLLNRLLGYPSRQLLTRANSGDTMGNPSSVVGYAALGMFDAPSPKGSRLSQGAGQALVAAARQTLQRGLAGKKTPQPVASLDRYPELSRANGLFVTLRKRGALRGCIGRIRTNEPLSKSLPVVAMDAALRDSRFAPVTAQELPELQIEVSVLTPPIPIKHVEELVPGRDGVILNFEGHQGVFLPQVWEETGWTRLEFLRELAGQKAGLPPDAWQQAILSVFQDQIFEEPAAQLPGGAATAH